MTRHAWITSAKACPGFSLVEMVVSLAVISVLLMGMTSAIVLASRALPSHDGPAAATVTTARALHQLQDELRAATELLNLTAASVTLHLPDRDGDGRPEVVTYTWAGTPGEPLIRSVNGVPATLLDNVASLDFSARALVATTDFDPPVIESDEIEFSSHDGLYSSSSNDIKDDGPFGFRFTPSLPTAATEWRVTRVFLRTSIDGYGNGVARFDLTGWTGSAPDSNLRESLLVPESSLNADFNWVSIPFEHGGPFTRGQTAALTFFNAGSGNAGQVEWDAFGSPVNIYEGEEKDGVYEYDMNYDGRMNHFLYGKYMTAGDPWSLHRGHLTTVGVALVHADAPAIEHRMTSVVSNAPLLADAFWEADFNADPTALDLNDNDSDDWGVGAGAFNSYDINNGAWTLRNVELQTNESHNLDTPLRLDLRMRDLYNNNTGGGVTLRCDRIDNGQLLLGVRLDNVGSEQTLVVSGIDTNGTTAELCTASVAVDEWVKVQINVAPSLDTANVIVNGQDLGSYTLHPISDTADPNLVFTCDNDGSGLEIDHVRLSVAGVATSEGDELPDLGDVLGGAVGGLLGIFH